MHLLYKEVLPANIGIRDGSLWFVKVKSEARFEGLGGGNKYLVEQDFCFYYMFKTILSGHNEILGSTNKIWWHCP